MEYIHTHFISRTNKHLKATNVATQYGAQVLMTDVPHVCTSVLATNCNLNITRDATASTNARPLHARSPAVTDDCAFATTTNTSITPAPSVATNASITLKAMDEAAAHAAPCSSLPLTNTAATDATVSTTAEAPIVENPSTSLLDTCSGTAVCIPYAWGDKAGAMDLLAAHGPHFDMVVGADLLYQVRIDVLVLDHTAGNHDLHVQCTPFREAALVV